MTNYLRHFLTIFFCLLFSEHFVIAQELSSEEWDAKYTSWDSQLESGIQAVEEKKYNEARAHLLKAYELAQELFEEDDEDLGETAVRYGEVNRKLGLFEEAEKAYRTALNYVRLDLGEEDVSFGFIMNQLGLTYDDLEDYDAAFSCFNQAISSAKVHFGEEHIQYLARMQNLALVYLSLDDNVKALPIFEEVVEKAENLLDENSNTLGAFYNNLGLAYLNFNNRIDEAEIVLTKAVNISEINNEYGFSYVMRLFNLANVYYTQGLMQEAFNFLQKALFTAEENIPNHPINLKLYNNLSTLYFAFDNIEKAGDYYNLSIKFIEENGLENTDDDAILGK